MLKKIKYGRHDQKLIKVSNEQYETAVVDTEYYSPNQHGNIYQIVYRQYFLTSLPSFLTAGNNVLALVDHALVWEDIGVRYIGRGHASDGTNIAFIYKSNQADLGNLTLYTADVTLINGWVDYTKYQGIGS